MARFFVFLIPLILLSAGLVFALNRPFNGLLGPNKGNIENEPTNKNSVNAQYQTPITIDFLRSLKYDAAVPKIEQELPSGSNYKRFISSYVSDGYKIYGLLTIPKTPAPNGGYPAIIFNHGYIPPDQYKTTEKYVSYVDNLAKNGFVVFKIDLRGHGDSEGSPSGSYFSAGYTIDAINAVRSLQKMTEVNSTRIGIWGHSMSGNLVLRAMEVLPDIKAGVIWAGAVYSYEDLAKYRINDTSYSRRPRVPREPDPREASSSFRSLLDSKPAPDFNDALWSGISLTKNIRYLENPIQLHHAVNDTVVNIGYSRDLVDVLKENNKEYEYYEYSGGGHNIDSPNFEKAIQRTIDFYKANL